MSRTAQSTAAQANRRTEGNNSSPTHPAEGQLADVVHRNIGSLAEVRQKFEERKSLQDRIADRITAFTGSLWFVYMHLVILALWLLINTRLIPGVQPFDPYPFVMLAMAASVEAIFLSTFVLISQNRSAVLAEKRAELDLQINLLSEHEVTRLIDLVDRIADKLQIARERPQEEVDQLKRDVAPEKVLEVIEQEEQQRREGAG